MDFSDIRYKNWQLSNTAPGEVVEGIADVNQCVVNIISTRKGSDPLRPDFGADLYAYVDKPTTIAGPNIQREIIEGLLLWEQRITAVNVSYEQVPNGLNFYINWVYNELKATTTVRIKEVTGPVAAPGGVSYWGIEFDFIVS